jgi:hypothetical protein
MARFVCGVVLHMIQIRTALDTALAEHIARQRWPPDLARPLTDDEWDLVNEEGQVRALERGRIHVDQIRDRVIQMRRAYPRPERAPRRAASAEQPAGQRESRRVHEKAWSAVLLAHAELDTRDQWGIGAFRDEVLGGTVVRDLKQWLDVEVRRQGRPTIVRGRVSLLAIRVRDEILRRATRRGRPLDRLRQISERLAAFYGWDPADAATYVLAGTAPQVRAIEGRVQLKFPLPARARIILTIDPTSTPAEVVAAYSRLRTQQFGRVRRLRAKHAELAVFTIRHAALTLDEQLTKWNSSMPRKRYRFRSVFKREAERARRSLVELLPQRARR